MMAQEWRGIGRGDRLPELPFRCIQGLPPRQSDLFPGQRHANSVSEADHQRSRAGLCSEVELTPTVPAPTAGRRAIALDGMEDSQAARRQSPTFGSVGSYYTCIAECKPSARSHLDRDHVGDVAADAPPGRNQSAPRLASRDLRPSHESNAVALTAALTRCRTAWPSARCITAFWITAPSP